MLPDVKGEHLLEHIKSLSAEIETLETRRRCVEQKRDEAIRLCMEWVRDLNASVVFLHEMRQRWRAQAEAWEQVKKEQRLRRKNMTPEEKQMQKEKIEELIRQQKHYQTIKKQIIFYERTRKAERSL